jgi:hypothetical protein
MKHARAGDGDIFGQWAREPPLSDLPMPRGLPITCT